MPAGTVLISLVLQGNLGEVHEEVLDLGIRLAALGAAEVVEPFQLVEEVVDNGNNDGDTDREGPDDHHGDDTGVAVREKVVVGGRVRGLATVAGKPAEDTEEG